MSAQWGEVARRGEFDLVLLTQDRARCEGFDLPPERHYLGQIFPTDGREPFAIAFLALPNVASFLTQMQPCSLVVRGAVWEDAGALREALVDLASSGAVH